MDWSKLKSRKFWMVIIGVVVTIGTTFGVDMGQAELWMIAAVDGLIALYVIIQGAIDRVSN